MTTKLTMLKQAALAVCCAASLGAIPLAHARSNVDISVGAGPAYYYSGYYNPPARCYYDGWGNYHCRPYYYGYPAYYGPGIALGYYGGWGHRGWRGDGGWHAGHGGWHGHDGGHNWHR